MTKDTGERTQQDGAEDLTDLKFIGPATADVIADADFDVESIRSKRVSYRMLVDAGSNPGVASKIRREHSLPWSITGGGSDDLDKRSNQVRGLRDEERAWVAASSGDWESQSTPPTDTAEADGSGESEAAEAAWRERSRPEPVTSLEGITQDDADALGTVGINSVRSLATIDPEQVSDLLQIDENTVAGWREQAADEV